MNRDHKPIKTRKMYRAAGIGMLTVLAAGFALGVGTAPRYIEELCIGGGFGDSVDGGADIEQDGDITTDGSLQIGGELTGDTDGPLTLSSDESIIMQVDTDNDGTETFQFLNGTDDTVAEINESGNIEVSGDVDVGDDIIMSHGASLNEDIDGELALSNARFYVKSDFGATDGKGLYLRNTNGTGTGVYELFHYYNGGHRYWSVGTNGGSTNNFVISHASDLSVPKLTMATDGDVTLAGGLSVSSDLTVDKRLIMDGIVTFTANDTTPSVASATVGVVPNTWASGNDITNFDDGVEGQILYILGGDPDCVIEDDDSNMKMSGHFIASARDTLTLIKTSSGWVELSRSDN